jgi:hypothetical protein
LEKFTAKSALKKLKGLRILDQKIELKAFLKLPLK